MQIFDGAALLLTLVAVGLLAVPNQKRRWKLACAALMALSLLLHLGVEGARWQMVPGYVTALVVGGLLLRQSNLRQRPTLAVWLGTATAPVLLGVSVLLSWAFPVFALPAPGGEYLVGTQTLHLVDRGREEGYTETSADQRELMLRIWYPAQAPSAERAAYWDASAVRSRAVTASTPLPWFTFTHLGRVDTHSFWDAPIARDRPTYPVVIYSHGIGIGWASANTKLAEGLASHGYIVIGINHAYIGSISIYPDGRTARFDPATARAMNQPPGAEVLALQARVRESTDWREQLELYDQAMALMVEPLTRVTEALNTQIADQRFVLDQLKFLKATDAAPWAVRMNLGQIGLIGMSLGGSATLETCSVDARCRAGVNLDGYHPRHRHLSLTRAPFLFLNRLDNPFFNANFESAESPVYAAVVGGVTHFNFFDFALMSPLYQLLGVLGPMDGARMLDLTGDYTRAFFDRHLQGLGDDALESLAQRYPEAELRARNAPSRASEP